MASNPTAMASNLRAMASNPTAMASNLRNSNGNVIHPNSDGERWPPALDRWPSLRPMASNQPNSNGLQLKSDGLQPIIAMGMASSLRAMASNLRAMASNLRAMASNLRAMASNLRAMASNLRTMASNQKAREHILIVSAKPGYLADTKLGLQT